MTHFLFQQNQQKYFFLPRRLVFDSISYFFNKNWRFRPKIIFLLVEKYSCILELSRMFWSNHDFWVIFFLGVGHFYFELCVRSKPNLIRSNVRVWCSCSFTRSSRNVTFNVTFASSENTWIYLDITVIFRNN